MIAALLADSPSRLLNFSHISDVERVAEIINSLGGKASEQGERAYLIDPNGFSQFSIDEKHGEASRASTLFIPALVAKFGKAIVPFPGGDKIGARPLDLHFEGFESLGAHVNVSNNQIEVIADELHGAHYRFAK